MMKPQSQLEDHEAVPAKLLGSGVILGATRVGVSFPLCFGPLLELSVMCLKSSAELPLDSAHMMTRGIGSSSGVCQHTGCKLSSNEDNITRRVGGLDLVVRSCTPWPDPVSAGFEHCRAHDLHRSNPFECERYPMLLDIHLMK
jgi:hypothetical protein